MRQFSFLIFIGTFFFVYGGLNYYIGLRIWQAFSIFLAPYKRIYWIVFWLIAVAFILARLGERFLGTFNGKWLAIVGGYWLAVMYYLFLIFILLDLFKLLNRCLRLYLMDFRTILFLA